MPRPELPVRRSPDVAWWVTVPAGIAAVVLTALAQAGRAIPQSHWLLALLYLGLFILAEATAMRFEVRRQAYSLTVVEVPLLLAVVYLSPVLVVAARVCAALIVKRRRGQTPVKMWFNIASNAAAAAMGALIVVKAQPIVDGVPRPLDVSRPGTWLILFAAVGAGVFMTVGGVTLVITLVQGRIPTADLVRTAIPSLVVGAINTTLGLSVLLVLQ